VEPTFLQFLIFYCLYQLKGERTIYSIFHLLQGKRSSQTIQDAHLFRLKPLYGTYSAISRQELEYTVSQFVSLEWLVETSPQRYHVTKLGEDFLLMMLKQKPIPIYLNGFKYGRQSELFWERLSLAVQVISYLQYKESHYIPIQKRPETLLWMKQFLQQTKHDRKSLSVSLYRELMMLFEYQPKLNPDLLVMRLSGYQSIGLTAEQAAHQCQMEWTHYHYHFLDILHYMMVQIETNMHQYTVLSLFLDKTNKPVLTHSTEKTLSLLEQGYTISEITAIRQLKQNTIEDHIVELALNRKDFSIDCYVSKKKQVDIQKAVSNLKTKQLKQIIDVVEDITYFEIRLVLAKYGEGL
jgi:uncharacterized protein YpbB